MTLPTGTIYLSQVNTELGRTSTQAINLNDSAVRSLAQAGGSGAINMNQLRGKSNSTGTATLSQHSVYAGVITGTATATYTISSDGNVYEYINNGGAGFVETWKSGSAGSSDYEVYVSLNSGYLDNGIADQWLALSSSRQWVIGNSLDNTHRGTIMTFSIRKISTQVITTQVQVDLSADVGQVS